MSKVKEAARNRKPWAEHEDMLLATGWGRLSKAQLMALLTGRTWASIQQRACYCELTQSEKKQRREPLWPVPAHDYTAEDIALREWGSITRTGQLRPIVKTELEAA